MPNPWGFPSAPFGLTGPAGAADAIVANGGFNGRDGHQPQPQQQQQQRHHPTQQQQQMQPQAPTRPEDFPGGQPTTVMLRNIPNRYTQDMLLGLWIPSSGRASTSRTCLWTLGS